MYLLTKQDLDNFMKLFEIVFDKDSDKISKKVYITMLRLYNLWGLTVPRKYKTLYTLTKEEGDFTQTV